MIKDVFQLWCNNLELSQETIDEMDSYKTRIAACVDTYFESNTAIKNSEFIGSYGRKTAVSIENTRLLVTIPEEYYWRLSYGKERILDELLRALRRQFLSCDYSDSANALYLNIDGDLSFEIIPGFMFEQGEYIYLLHGDWKELHLGYERKNFADVNNKTHNNLIRLCKLLKEWKRQNDVEISNILLDTFAFNYYKYYASQEYSLDMFDEMLTEFFKYMLRICRKDSHLSFDGKTKLIQHYDIYRVVFDSSTLAQTALTEADCGMPSDAEYSWKRILGHGIEIKR